jgi:hypothetical protein
MQHYVGTIEVWIGDGRTGNKSPQAMPAIASLIFAQYSKENMDDRTIALILTP